MRHRVCAGRRGAMRHRPAVGRATHGEVGVRGRGEHRHRYEGMCGSMHTGGDGTRWMSADPSDVTIGIITALPVEYAAVRVLLIDPAGHHVPGDANSYDVARLPSAEPGLPHRVALLMLPQDGTRTAAAACTDAARSFPGMRCVVTCGIAGGVPTPGRTRPLRLGDVVVATSIVDYGHVRSVDGRDELRRPPPRGPSYDLLRAVNVLRARALHGDRPWDTWLDMRSRPSLASFARPPGARGGTRPEIHYGPVASGDRLLRDARERDRLAAEHRVLAVEMEASGIAVAAALHGIDWFMIRGIADFCDGAKDDRWHPYASLAAAAYLRVLLAECRPYRPARPARPASLQARNRLVDLLLAVPAVADLDSRQSVISNLPPVVRDAVRRHPIARVEVLNLVSTCLDYPHGLDALMAAIQLVEGETPAFRRLRHGLEGNLGTRCGRD